MANHTRPALVHLEVGEYLEALCPPYNWENANEVWSYKKHTQDARRL